MRFVISAVFILTGFFVLPLGAQDQAAQPTDSLSVAYLRSILRIRNSLSEVQAASFAFTRSLNTLPDETLLASAARVRANCETSLRVITSEQGTFDGVTARPEMRRWVVEYHPALNSLKIALQDQCLDGIPAEGPRSVPDSIKAWGYHRMSELGLAIRTFSAAQNQLARSTGLHLAIE